MDLPLSGIVVVDLVHGPMAPITRYLVELGARVERFDGDETPDDPVEDIAANVGKCRRVGGMDQAGMAALVADAHVVVMSRGGTLDLDSLCRDRPDLVAMMVSDFGADTSIARWQGTGPVLHALSGELARSGIRGRAPLLPPGDLAYQCAAAQAAFVLVTALYRALRTGVGDLFDFSALDGAVQALDPGYGIGGSATLGKPAKLLSRERPAKGFQYPIFRCVDGHVRICLLARRQWQGMFRWMGEPAQFASPEFEKVIARYKSPDLLPAIGAFFADKTRAEIEAGGQAHGVPVSALLAFEECIDTPHMRERGVIAERRMVDGRAARVPNGMMCIDGERAGVGDAAPVPAFVRASASAPASPRPFDGLRVLDLGVIVVGAEQARLLADQGADVVKVESRAYPDGNRQSYLPYGLSVSFAAGHRNKRSLGINLRDPEGRRLFLELAATADIIMSNFKPGTMESLGLSYREVAAVNPGIVMTDSSAFGADGPWSGRMGYGPLVRAATGLTLAWRYPDDPESFSDSITIYPDHVAGRISAIGAVALLIRRLRTGRGGTVSVAQSEVMIGHFAADVARLSIGDAAGVASRHPWGVYAAKGEDEWCVVTATDDAARGALCALVGIGDDAAPAAIDAALTAWLAERTPMQAAEELQAGGVAAAPMLRVSDLPDFPYYRERGFFRDEPHPYLAEDVLAERVHVRGRATIDAPRRPAPLAGEHSAEIVTEWLATPPDMVDAALASGVLEGVDPAEWTAIDGVRARRSASA